MKNISRWASKNTKVAIILLIFLEINKILIGLILGISLPAFTHLSIEISVFAISILLLFVGKFYEMNLIHTQNRFRFRRICIGIFMASSFGLSILLGNHLQKIPFSRAFAVEIVEKQEKTTISTDSLRTLIEQEKTQTSLNSKPKERPPTEKIIGFVALFFLGMVVTVYGLYLACGLACAGYAVLSVLTFLVILGSFSGGVYFLGRALTKRFKPYKQMDKAERRKEWKKWGKIVAFFTLLFGLLIAGNLNR